MIQNRIASIITLVHSVPGKFTKTDLDNLIMIMVLIALKANTIQMQKPQ